MDFTLDPTAARQADQRNGRITESGKYVGSLTRAEFITSKTGTKGVEFSFAVDENTNADYLTVWTDKADGTALSGRKSIMALLACLKLRGARLGKVSVEKYDRDQGKRVTATIEGYPDMMGKPIGVVLQKELYTSNQGDDKERVNIVTWFCAETERTAAEILDKAVDPEQLPKLMAWLADHPEKDSRVKPGSRTIPDAPRRPAPKPAQNFDDLDVDIPF